MIRKINLIILLSIGFIWTASSQQAVVESTNGYSVKITVAPKSVLPYGNNCKWGYNYDISFDYAVEFTGRNTPKSLYTLQGTIVTGSQSMFFDIPNKQSSGSSQTDVHAWTSSNDCKTVTLETINFKKVVVEIEGPGIPHQYVTILVSSLPIELISFEGKRNGNSMDLFWSTASETNNDYFTIERSSNGIDYEFVAKVKGAGNSNQKLDYSFVDQYVSNDVKYYRLRQTDFDGTSVCSKPISIASVVRNSSKAEVYPNPNSTSIITFTATSPELYELTVVAASGNTVFNQQLSDATISLPDLTAGLYILQFKNTATGEIQIVKYLQK